MNPSRRSLLAAFGSVFLAAGCSSGNGSTSTPPAGGGAPGTATGAAPPTNATAGDAITIQNFAFAPVNLSVAAGSTVSVTNKDSVTHTVTSSDAAKAFDTGNIAAGATATFKAPSQPGSYAYTCTIHPFMHGTLTVQ